MIRMLTYVGLVGALTVLTSAAPASVSDTPASQSNILLVTAKDISSVNIDVDCYPQALPNDGRSEAEISVVLTDGDEPLPDVVVRAEIVDGDGILFLEEIRTDIDGVAVFPYRAGFMPERGQLSFSVPDTEASASLSIPLAPVSYLDVLLVTPEEYLAHLKRQAAAAPIYTLRASVFPDQLAADGGSLAAISIGLNHVDGSPAAGVPLLAEVISGEGSLEQSELVTDLDGAAEVYFIADLVPGTVSVMILEPSTGLTTVVDILLVEAGPARVQLRYIEPLGATLARDGAIMPADGLSGLPVVAEVTDLNGIPLAGVELDLSVLDETNGWIEVLDPVSDIAGHVEFIYHAGTSTGLVRLRAFIAGGLDFGPPSF